MLELPGKSTDSSDRNFNRAANFPHGLTRRSPSSVGFSFHLALRRGYSGSADTLEEEVAKAAFSSPPRCRAFSPVAYRLDLPTVGRRRASPVMTQDHFLQAAACITQVVPPSTIHSDRGGNEDWGHSSTLRPRAVSGAPRRPETPPPEVILLGPFDTPPSPDLPVATCWLLTSADRCGVRARCSVRAWTRTGRLWQFVILLSSPHPFFWW